MSTAAWQPPDDRKATKSDTFKKALSTLAYCTISNDELRDAVDAQFADAQFFTCRPHSRHQSFEKATKSDELRAAVDAQFADAQSAA